MILSQLESGSIFSDLGDRTKKILFHDEDVEITIVVNFEGKIIEYLLCDQESAKYNREIIFLGNIFSK